MPAKDQTPQSTQSAAHDKNHRTEDSPAVLVYVTVPDYRTGMEIGRAMVNQRLAACANFIPMIHSIYWWDGSVQDDQEALLFLKTRPELAKELVDAVAEEHPYEVPAISVLPLTHVHDPYLKWLVDETSER